MKNCAWFQKEDLAHRNFSIFSLIGGFCGAILKVNYVPKSLRNFPLLQSCCRCCCFVSWWSLFSRSKLSTKLASRTLIMTPSFICCQEFFAWAPRLPRECVCVCACKGGASPSFVVLVHHECTGVIIVLTCS